MKKTLGTVVMVSLLSAALVFPTLAADTTTSASVPANTTVPKTTTTTPKTTYGNPAPTTTGGTVYTVVSGDVFWRIAKKNNLTMTQLAKLNPQVKNINKIYPGDKLVVKAAATTTTPTTPTTPVVTGKKLYYGVGEVPVYRPSKNQLNMTTASVIFDENGKIVDVTWDVMEITTKLFTGWHDPKADQATIDAYTASINPTTWLTKRELGYKYDMTRKAATGAATNLSKKEWFEQLNYYETFFKGKTVAEVEAWFTKYTDAAGRPYKMAYPEKLTDADKAKVANFTATEKAMLVDVTTSATMSLKDDHSDFITSLKEAYAAKREIKF
jgi:LysM repeat protein